MDMEFTNGQTVANIKVTGSITKYQALGNINGMIKEVIEGTGKIIICMVKEYIHGLMAGNTKENMLMIKNMGMEFTHILMAGAIKDNGLMANNTERASSLHRKVLRRKACGRMERGCNGLMMMNEKS